MLLWLLGCFTVVNEELGNRYPERPFHDFDGDGLEDVDDCDDSNPAILGKATFYRDEDGDGYGIEAEQKEFCSNEDTSGYVLKVDGEQIFDCDDTDATLNHNDVDQDGFTTCTGDCDDLNSEVISPEIFYQDADGDGFAKFSVSETVCPADHSENFIQITETALEDCDDDNPDVSPIAQEICDELDNDCNGQVDEYQGVEGTNIYYHDGDGDGYGVYDAVLYACEGQQPEGYITTVGDCDDSDALVHPWTEGLDGGIELCDQDGKDENCNGIVNEDSALDATIWYEDSDSDGFGSNFVIRNACEQPTGFIAASGDCNDLDAAIFPNAIEACNGLDDDCDASIDEGTNSLAPSGSNTYYVDSDSDGFGDAGITQIQCNQPSGFVSDSSDCNDLDPEVYPNAVEYCNGVDDDCDGNTDEEDAVDKSIFFVDIDNDGYGDPVIFEYVCPLNQSASYVSNNSDCDDDDPAQYPGADELCNNEDDDCNGGVDETYAIGITTFYADLDNDGYGNALNPTLACEAPNDTVEDATDCNDSSALVYPNALEYCNNIDDDCNGAVDDIPEDATTYYIDSDGHGALVDTATGYDLISCPNFDAQTGLPVTPEGYSESNDDCDDSSSGISPSADEFCTDSIDENCDGHMIAQAVDLTTYYADSDDDGFGNPLYILEVCTQPLGYIEYQQGDLIDCNDNDEEVFPLDPNSPTYAVDMVDQELCNGKVDRCDNDIYGDLTPPDDERDDDDDGYVECTIESYFLYNQDGTVNSWGNEQIIYGDEDCEDDDSNAYPGALEICNGVFENCSDSRYSSQDAPDNELDDDGDFYVECESFDAQTWEGDVSVIGGLDCNDAVAQAYPGAAPNTNPDLCLTDIDGDGFADRYWGNCPTGQTITEARYLFQAPSWGIAVDISSGGDVDGDGLDDILVGGYLFLGSSLGGSSTFNMTEAEYSFQNSTFLTGLGDVDGDGLDDILVSDSSGNVYLFLGSSLDSVGPTIYSYEADYTFTGGTTVAPAGDVDGDGLDDILIGDPLNMQGGYYAGKVYLILGSSLGSSSSTINLSQANYTFIGGATNKAGESMSSAGDVDGDGLDDILIGTMSGPVNGSYTGGAHLILGSSLGSSSSIDLSNADYFLIGENGSDHAGASVSSAGDVDGDGLDDILIGAPENAQGGGSNNGKVYLIFGSSFGNSSVINLSQADYSFLTEHYNAFLGTSVSNAGDVDGDGLSDILLGQTNSVGRIYLIFGSSLGGSSLINLTNSSNADYLFLGETNMEVGGFSAPAGDVDGDGLDDFLIGTQGLNKVGLFSACE